MIWALFFLGLAFADKLDRTYLPPSGSKFSGGSPGAIQVPLDDTISQYPSSNDKQYISPEIAIGIDRVPSKRPVDRNSPFNNPSTYPENTYVASTTVNPYQKTTISSSNNGYSTLNPNYISNYSKDTQIPDNLKNSYKNLAQYPSGSNEDQFQTNENYPQLYQENIPTGNNGKDFTYSILSNQSDFSNTGTPQSSPTPQLVTGFINNEYNPNQYFSSSIPPVNVNNNVVSSTASPSTINYNYGTTAGPNQFYSSTSKPPQYSTAIPVGSKNSQVFNYANIRKRPERIEAQADREAVILNYESSITPEGYSYSYDTSNGIHGDENGVTLNGVKAKGSYSYIGDDGKLYSVVYTADEHGFRPQGEHLPTSPPIPDAILKVIEQVTKEKEAGIVDDGSYDDSKYGYRKYHNGFYTPQSYFNKLNSNIVKDQRLIQNTDNTPYNRGGIRNGVADKTYEETNVYPNSNEIRNQIANENDKRPSVYQDSVKKQNIIPTIDNLANYGNNLEKVDSHLPIQSNDFYKNFGIKGTESDNISDLERKNDANNKSHNDLPKQAYDKLVGDQIRHSINNQTIGDLGINREGINGRTNVYKIDESITGYHYNPPQYTLNNQFPSRFSDLKTVLNEAPRQENIKITPKPFLTPYVRSEDEIQNYDNYGKPLKNPESEYYEDLNEDTNDNILNSGEDFNENDAYNKTDFYKNQYDNGPINVYQSEDSKTIDQDPQNINGYFYQQGGTDSDIPNNKFVAGPHSYTSSTALPTEFTTRINTAHSKGTEEPNLSSEKQISIKSKSGIPSTTYLPNAYPQQFNKTNTSYHSTVKPGFVDRNGANIPGGATNVYPGIDYNTTPRNEHSTNLPIIGNSYSPNLDITHADEYNRPTTVKAIGEDFTGPKQQSRFDPLTGYYY